MVSSANRLLITGASGFVGANCLPFLADRFDEVVATSRSERLAKDNVRWYPIDLLESNPADLIRVARPTHLLHLAWEATPGEYWTSPLNSKWRTASQRLVDCFMSSRDAERVLVVGTCAEFEWQNGICDSQTKLSFETPYASAKNQLHQDLLDSGIEDQLVWARLFFVFGPHEPIQKLVPYVINQLLRNEVAECSDGKHRRDFIYIKDAARAICDLLTSNLCGSFNIGAGTAVPVRSVVEKISHILGSPELVRFRQAESKQVPLVVGNCSRLHSELNFQPNYDLDSALADTVQWWKSSFLNQAS